jgi:hypothetical protein
MNPRVGQQNNATQGLRGVPNVGGTEGVAVSRKKNHSLDSNLFLQMVGVLQAHF